MSEERQIWADKPPPKNKPRPRPERRGNYLSTKQRRFVEIYCSDPSHNPVAAYLAAGYRSSKSAPIESRKLLDHPAVKNYLSRHLSSFSSHEQTQIMEGQAKCIEFWKRLMDGEEICGERIQIKHRLEASTYLAKACGLQDRFSTRQLEARVSKTTNNSVTVNAKDGGATRIEFVDPFSGGGGGGRDGVTLDAEVVDETVSTEFSTKGLPERSA